jgi:hypothetical protein
VLPGSSPAEIEIRAIAVERLVALLRHRAQPVTTLDLDNLFWSRGGQAVYKARPRHRIRTVFN